jgi:hypothetical protein
MEKDIKSFTDKYNKTQDKISKLTEAFKSMQTADKDVVVTTSNDTKKEISSIFDGSKTIYRASTNGKNVMHFTSLDQAKDYLDK